MDYCKNHPWITPQLDNKAIESKIDQVSISILLTGPSTGLGVYESVSNKYGKRQNCGLGRGGTQKR